MDKHDQMFAGIVMQYQQMAMMALGKIARPEGGMRRDLQEATIFIDILEMLQEKTKGNLPTELERLLPSTLADLRLNYVEEAKRPDAPAAEAGDAAATASGTAE